MGRFYDGTALPLSVGFCIAGLGALLLAELAARGEAAPIEPFR
jgi:DHA1 family bicyclomycin/chloramphenicol resistance-like MFS transporter